MVFGIGTKNIGIDLGTANTIVYEEGKGIVLREPSVVAKNIKTGEVVSVGSEARDMIGRTPESIVAIRPMKDGVIADYDTTVSMMQYYIQKALGNKANKPYVMVCVPSGVTEVEKRAVIDATRVAGAILFHQSPISKRSNQYFSLIFASALDMPFNWAR